MSKLLHVLICYLAIIFFNRIVCIKLTKENVISLVKFINVLSDENISEIDPLALEVLNGTSLYLNDNELKYLQEDLFNYNTKFEHLFFYSNNISKIHPLAFKELQNLTQISLGDNELAEIDENLFARNTKLLEISLYENRIKFFHPNTFKNLKNLLSLSVSHNELSTFDFNLFSSNKELQTLYIRNNGFSKIRYKDLKLRFPKLSTISLGLNKFNCSFAKQIDDYLDKELIYHFHGPISCINDEEYAAIVCDHQYSSNTPIKIRH